MGDYSFISKNMWRGRDICSEDSNFEARFVPGLDPRSAEVGHLEDGDREALARSER